MIGWSFLGAEKQVRRISDIAYEIAGKGPPTSS